VKAQTIAFNLLEVHTHVMAIDPMFDEEDQKTAGAK
jgi:hypothetical protein